MKIKTVKKLNLHELIEHVWDNDIRGKSFKSNLGIEVIISRKNRKVFMNHYVGIDETFTVEVEEELTMLTVFKDLVEVLFDNTVIDYRYTSISVIQGSETSEIYVPQNGKLQLIWSADTGIPVDGVLEVNKK